MRYFRTENNTGFKYIHSKDDKVIYIENETANAPQFSLQYGDKMIQIFINDGIYRPERDIEGTPDLFSLSYISDSRDKGQSIFATEAEINIYEDDYFNIDELKTASETEILIKYFEKGSLMWSGFVLPDFFQTGITNVRVLKMVASDRIATLKETSNQTVSDTPIKIIAEALKNTGLDLGINVIAKNDFLQTITIERERIKDISSYDLIRTFMILFNCKIVQYSNKWWIVNKSKLESGYIDYKSYTSEGTFVNSVAFNQKIIPFNQVDTNGERSIRPTASEVSLFLEYGGSKKYPKNWDFEEWNGTKFTDWDSVGLTQILNKKQVDNYTNVGDYYKSNLGSDIDENSLFIETTGYDSRQTGNYITIPHIKSTFVKMPFTEGQTEVSVKFNLTVPHQKMIRVLPLIKLVNINPSMHEYFAIDEDGSVKKAGVGSVNLKGISPLKVGDNSDGEALTTAIQTVWEQTFSFKQEDFNRTRGVNAEIQLLVFKSRMTFPSTIKADVFIHSAEVIFNKSEVIGKGLIFKTKQGGGKFSKVREPETVLFSDKINQGVNGFFYNYKYDDTSIVGLPEEFALASVRERALMFSQARDYFSLSGKIEVNPIAKYTCKDKSFVLVGGESRRKDSSIEIEEIVSQSLESTDYIYTYFDEGKDKVKNIKGVGSAGSGGGSGGGIDANSHNHPNKEVLDTITQEMLDNALREILGVDSTEEATDENFFSALRTLKEILDNNEVLKGLFLSKTNNDTAQGFIEFLKGISVEELATLTQGLEVGDFTTGALGAGAAVKMVDGTSYAEVDNLIVRQKATFRELIIESLKHIGGQLVLTPARMKCIRVVDGGTFYKCYFDTGDGEVSNEFVAGDLARCQVFTGNGTKFYWRLVTLVGEDWINLSKTSAAVGSDAPEAGDDIAQLGNATDTTRQNAQILSTVGVDAPSWKQYKGINSFSLEGKDTTVFSGLGNKISGETVFTSGGANLEDHLDGVAQDILDALRAAQDAEDKAQQAIEDAEADVAIINTEIGRLQDQIDGKVSNWYYAYSPTLENYPASDWTTNEIKDAHIGDTFTNTEPAPAENAGKSWRFIKDGSTYSWIVISDSDALKALQEASKAQATADGKSTTYLFQPSKYKLGDMWVLNDDHTINGTAYKQGDLLTATQDSETFHEAHWLKRVRYTDDTKIDNLEIGGRNLIVLQNVVDKNGRLNLPQNSTNYVYSDVGYYTTGKIYVNEGDEVVLTSHRIISGYLALGCFDEDDIYFSRPIMVNNSEANSYVLTLPSGVAYIRVSFLGSESNYIKLEKGNKATDWTPAPEDVQANIETAKTEAESAARDYADIQAEAERIKAEAYADGIVSEEEQARINDVNDKLAAAKDYADAQDVVLKTQQEAYADGKISESEQAAIDAAKAYADLKKTEAEAYADGIVSDEEARAIADAIDKYNDAKAHAEQLVKDIEIGGRNLIIGSFNDWRSATVLQYGHSVSVATTLIQDEWRGKTVTQSTEFKDIPEGERVQIRIDFVRPDNTYFGEIYGSIVSLSGKSYVTYTVPTDTQYNSIRARIMPVNYTSGYNVLLRCEKLEFGIKATDWTPAPEDVEANIATAKADAESAAQAYADTKSEAERVIAEAYADGIVSEEEQARINDVNDKLAAAKAYAEAQDALLKTQQEAYADGAISTAEQAAIDAAKDYADLKKTEAEAYADGIVSDEEARAIADALEKYNESKAYAETLVDDIEIGGRNYLPKSVFVELDYSVHSGTVSKVDGVGVLTSESFGIYISNALIGLDVCTVSAWLKGEGTYKAQAGGGGSNPDAIEVNSDVFKQYSITLTRMGNRNLSFFFNGLGLQIEKFKLEKGNKATDWTPAPEDVQADISDAKQAGLDAQSDLNTTKTTVNSLNAEWGEATQDGIIDDAERKAIGTTKKSVNESMAKVDATYNKLYNNQYLKDTLPHSKPKSNLKDARDAIWEKKEALFTRIDAVLDKAKNFETEKGLADTAFGVFDTHMGLYQKAVEDASESIQKALDKLSRDRVNDIEIGGRNLFLDSWGETRSDSLTSRYTLSSKIENGENFVARIKVKENTSIVWGNPDLFTQVIDGVNDIQIRIGYLTEVSKGLWELKGTWDNKTGDTIEDVVFFMRGGSRPDFEVEWAKLEKGTVATDWTPAPEDTQAKVDALEDFSNEAFADGVVDRAEAKAIEKYINTVNESFESVKSTYDKMLLNSLLITAEKAKLTGKYTPLNTAKGNLMTAITTAIADGKATPAEKVDVDTKFGLYNTAMKAYQTALEEARIAMDVELKRLADEKVDNIEIGGRNLIIGSFNDWRSRTVSQYGYPSVYIPIQDDWRGKTVTHSFEVKDIPEGESVRIRIDFYTTEVEYIAYGQGLSVVTSGKSFINYIVPTDTQYNRIRARIMPVSYVAGYNVLFRGEKLEFGNKATDWTPAPEDVQAEIDSGVATVTTLYKNADEGVTVDKPTASNEVSSGWKETSPEKIDGKVIWSVHRVTLKNGTKVYSNPANIQGADGEGGINVMITRQGSFRTYWRQIGDQNQILTTPEKVSEIIGGVDIEGVKYVQCKVLIYKGSVDVTASALADPTTQGKWYLNNVWMASNTDTLNIPIKSGDITYADGVDDEVRFEYTDTNAKNWKGA